jgi:hypothetical protein
MCAFSAIRKISGLSLAAISLLQELQYDSIRSGMPLKGWRSNCALVDLAGMKDDKGRLKFYRKWVP